MPISKVYALFIIAMSFRIILSAKEDDTTKNGTLASYRNSCLRLQDAAKWITVLLKLKSAYVNTTTKIMLENNMLGESARIIQNIPDLPRIPIMKESQSDCSSLESLQITLRSFIHFQAQLLQLKATFGNVVLQKSIAQLNDSLDLMRQVKSFDLINRGASTAVEKLKDLSNLSNYGISNDDVIPKSVINTIRNAPKIIAYLQEQTNDIFESLLNVTKASDSLQQAQRLMVTGDLFKSLGRSLDNFLFH